MYNENTSSYRVHMRNDQMILQVPKGVYKEEPYSILLSKNRQITQNKYLYRQKMKETPDFLIRRETHPQVSKVKPRQIPRQMGITEYFFGRSIGHAFAVLVNKQETPTKPGYLSNHYALVKSSYQDPHSINR